jgi:phosphohistidine phosphatase
VTGRRLVLMRHARAEPYARTDAERRLTERGTADAAAAGRFLRRSGLAPDLALVSAAVRAVQTWAAVREACGPAEEQVDAGLFGASAGTVLETLRLVPPQARTVLLVGHNPAAGELAHALLDGDEDPATVRGLLEGFPPAALAAYTVTGAWGDLTERAARLTHFHVGGA